MSERCDLCGKRAYFAEKIATAGKTYHKWCFKCMQCGKTLTLGQQSEKDGRIYCKQDYAKLFGQVGFGFGGICAGEKIDNPRDEKPKAAETIPVVQYAPSQFLSPRGASAISPRSAPAPAASGEPTPAASEAPAPPARDAAPEPVSGSRVAMSSRIAAFSKPAFKNEPQRPSPRSTNSVASRFGGGAKCPRCDKRVYFAERFSVEGIDWHKVCFKCFDCGRSLTAGKYCETDQKYFCQPCYNKNFRTSSYGSAGNANW